MTTHTPTSRKSHRRTTVRRMLAAALAATALAGCTTQVSGTASPSPELLRGPTPVPASSLATMLASATTAARIVGASHLEVLRSGSEMLAGSKHLDAQRCIGPWYPASAPAYRGSDYTGVEVNQLGDSGTEVSDINSHVLTQAVVAFPTAADARTYLRDATEVWRDCGSQTVTYRIPGEGESQWALSAAKTTETTVSQTQTPRQGRGYICDRALQVENNIVIDAIACGLRANGQALDLTAAIAKNLPSLP